MPTASVAPPERARKIVSTVLHATQRDATQAAIAAAVGKSESTISRLLSDHLDTFAAVLAHAGLKVVPNEMQCFPQDKVHALLTLARDHLMQMEHPEQLTWE
jgi:phosphoglycerate-specific signal transduction histidine kinase